MTMLRRLSTWRGGYLFAVLAVVAATAVVMPLRALVTHVEVALLYIPVVAVVARVSGFRAGLFAAALAFLVIDFLFVLPYYTLSVASVRDWVMLVTFLLVAVLLSMQTGLQQRRETASLQRQRELAMLNRLSSRLLSEQSLPDMAEEIVREVVSVLGASRSALRSADEGGGRALLAEAGEQSSGRAEQALSDWVLANDKAVGLPPVPGLSMSERPASTGAADAVEGAVADGVYLPLQTNRGLEGVLYARPIAGAAGFDDDQLRMLVAIGNLASSYLERQRLQRAAATADAERETERLKGTLVSSVSHELKTPLAAVTATVTGLLEEDGPLDTGRVRDELRAIERDLARLHGSIGDLLDVSRLESDSWRTHPDEYDVTEILGTVASRLPADARGRLTFDMAEGLPTVRVDFTQWARALQNVIENALAYSPAGTPVTIGSKSLSGDVIVWIEDRGPGVPDAEKQKVFEKFYRGSMSERVASGTGLGLAIAREIVRAHKGRIWVEDAEPQGARFVVSVPALKGR
jgi:two-component system sensor histidine kinase KdpD